MRIWTAIVLLLGFFLITPSAQTRVDEPAAGKDVSEEQKAELKEADRIEVAILRLYSQGEFSKALPLAKRVLEIRERILAADHQRVVTALNNVTTLLVALKKYKEAEPLVQRVIEIKEKTLGPMHREVGKLLEQYACMLWIRGKEDEANQVETRIGRVLYNISNRSKYDSAINGKATFLPQPQYPEEARLNTALGRVVVWVLVDETGKVIEASGRCGAPSLVKASEEAAFRAHFKPTLVDGKPTRVRRRIIYHFVSR
jgi:TonB family protein